MTKPSKKGWFTIPGVQEGERTLAEGVRGLEMIRHDLKGQHVLDLGCAEGLIGHWCLERGAASVYGLDGNPNLIKTGQWLVASLKEPRLTLHFWNLNSDIRPPTDGRMNFGVVLALSIIHKLKDPERFLKQVAGLSSKWVVMRAPVRDIKVRDRVRLDIPARLERLDFHLVEETEGATVPWVAVFRRRGTGWRL